MAPNRKQISVALAEPTQVVVQAKYLPLTQIAPTAPPQRDDAPVSVMRSSVAPSVADDYWSWGASYTISNSNSKVEPKKDLFSAAHFEENAKRDYQRRQEEAWTQTFVRAAMAQQQEPSYWEERVESFTVRSDANARVGNTTGYWDWPEETRVNALQIALILQEELARQQVSAAAMEQQLVRDVETQSKKPYDYETKPEHDDYWAWTNPTTVRAASCDMNESYWEWTVPIVSTRIASLLEYEAHRSLFSVDHYMNLETTHTIKTATPTVRAGAVAGPPGYWVM